MGNEVERIKEKIRSFKRKYYLDLFLRGLILSALILSTYFLIAALVEHNLWLSPWARLITFISFFVVAVYCVVRFMREPIQWWVARRGMSEEESARIIGRSIPGVSDRLLNFIQLDLAKESNSLAYASIVQRSREFEPLSFESVVDLKQNSKFAKYLLAPLVIILGILIINKSILTQSTARIINFSREYSPAAPFQFIIKNSSLRGFYNEDFSLDISFSGASIPLDAYLNFGGQRAKLERVSAGNFTYTFEKLTRPITFQIEAAGFFSETETIELVNRPELTQLKVELEFPRYLKRANEQLINVGNLEIPEGTAVTWKMRTGFTESVEFQFMSDSSQDKSVVSENQTFVFKKTLRAPDLYEITLLNKNSQNKDKISYSIDVIKDQFPTISLNNLQDSVLFERILLGGTIGDDYGVSQLQLNFTLKDEAGHDVSRGKVPLQITPHQQQQNFFFNWSVDTLDLKPGHQLEYYLQVWDNDGVNGRKSSRSAVYSFAIPSESELMVQIRNSQSQTEQKVDQSVGKAQQLQDQIEQATQKLKGKQDLDWQDKKMLEDIVQQKQSLDKIIEKLQEENKLLNQKKDAFTEQDKRIKEKAEQIQKLMDELLDEETKKLFEELQKLLKQNAEVDDIQKILNKLNQNSDNLEKDLERLQENLKQLAFEFKMDNAIDKLNQQIQKQQDLLERTEQLEKEMKETKKNSEQGKALENESKELGKEQEQLRKDASETKEEIKELNKLGEELHNSDELPTEEESDEVIKDQEQSQESLQQNEPSKSKTPQKQSLQKMQQMQQKMEKAQSSMEMEMDMANLESLRQIIHSLVKLSYDQEALLKQFNELTPNDPRFNTIAQQQLKLKDDSKVLEDSLLALGKKDPFMGSFITKEIGELNNHLDRVTEANKERRRPQASTEMQASMTSINNLALMLDDHFEMMMQAMANAKPSSGKQKQKGKPQSLGEMQQKLNERIQQLKNSGKTGKQLSEELAEMAAEQERIRKAFQEMQERLEEQGGAKPGNQLPGKMEQTEMELVNKQLSDQLIRRQQEILTRLLEAEKSAREQDLDDERKGESAKDYDKEIPKAFEEYLRLKEKEVELLKTVPPKLYPYYKKEVSEYFKRMGK
jgi:hypothetical protein